MSTIQENIAKDLGIIASALVSIDQTQKQNLEIQRHLLAVQQAQTEVLKLRNALALLEMEVVIQTAAHPNHYSYSTSSAKFERLVQTVINNVRMLNGSAQDSVPVGTTMTSMSHATHGSTVNTTPSSRHISGAAHHVGFVYPRPQQASQVVQQPAQLGHRCRS